MFLRPPKVVQCKGALRSQSRDLKMFHMRVTFCVHVDSVILYG